MGSPNTITEAQSAGAGVRELRRLETRARLLDAALAEIGRSGLAGADVSAIASAAGVVRGTFYFHFPTQDHVLVELERNEEVRIVEELGAAQTETDDLVSVLSLLVRMWLPPSTGWVRWSSRTCWGCTSPQLDRLKTN